jgi:hypothetical protein
VTVGFVDSPIRIGKPDVNGARKIVQTLIIDKYADEHSKRGKAAVARAVTN